MKWVICCYEDAHCGKTPCMAVIDDSINIEKFNECFYSHVKVRWRLATKMESAFPKCLECQWKADENADGAEKRIYDHWNKVSPIKHRKLTEGMKKNIKSKLKEYKEEELIQCIDNYVKVVTSDCWYKYKSSLDDFFRPGVQKPAPCMKFLPDRFVYDNFINRNGRQTVPPGGSRII